MRGHNGDGKESSEVWVAQEPNWFPLCNCECADAASSLRAFPFGHVIR